MRSKPTRTSIALATLLIVVVLVVQRYRSEREGEVVFATGIHRVSIPIGERVVIDRGEVHAGAGSGAWETVAVRSPAHLTITHLSVFGERQRRMQFFVPLADLPVALPEMSPNDQRHMKMSMNGWLRLDGAN